MNDDELIKEVISEGAKNSIGKIIDGLGAFLGSICMPAADEIGLFLRDRIRLYRINNLNKVILKTKEKIGNEEIINNITPKNLIEFIECSSWIEDGKIQDLWAGLLKGILTNNSQSDSDLIYFNILKEINPYQARIIELIYNDKRICTFQQPLRSDISYDELNLNENIIIPIREILKNSPKPLDYIVSGHSHSDIINNESEHWLAFGFILPNITHLRRIDLIKAYEISDDNMNITFIPTITGLDFFMNCTGYKIYPIEAYLTARKDWCKKN